MLWLVFGLIASTRSQPVTYDALQEGVEVPEGVLRNEKDLQDLGNSQALGHMKTIASTLEHVFRQGRDLQDQVEEVTGRQTVATLASSLGDLFRPAITAFVGALTMNSATSITNAITAALGGSKLLEKHFATPFPPTEKAYGSSIPSQSLRGSHAAIYQFQGN